MSAIKATVRNRQLHVEVPADWPEGCEVVIEPVPARAVHGMREEDWPTTPEGIAALLKRWDELEPVGMTEEEIANWEAARRAQRPDGPLDS
jgi:hypothetical protein